MLNGEMQLLDARRIVGGNHEACVRQGFELAATLAKERDDGDAPRPCCLGGPYDVRALTAGGVHDEQVAGVSERFDLAREHFIEAHVVGARRQQRCVGGQRDRAHRRPIALVTNHVFRRQVLRVGGAAAVAHKEQRPAAAPRRLVALRDGGDCLGLLRGDPAGKRCQAVERLPDFRDAQRAASTNASRPPRPPRRPTSPCGPSSMTVPITTKSAPAPRAARACPGVRIPPPTNSGRCPTAARHARITSTGTGRSAPLPPSRYTACMPINEAAVACAAASSGLSDGSGRVWLTDSTLVTRPPSIRMYAVDSVGTGCCCR